MMDAGVFVQTSLKVNIFRMWFQRLDLRNHRKIVVIDDKVAYTGSQNMVDPRFFKQNEKVGEWIDTMVKLKGPSVAILNSVFAGDWSLDTDISWADIVAESDNLGDVAEEIDQNVQIIPSSPGAFKNSIHEIIMGIIYNADWKITITTPYFVPTEAMINALCSKSQAGCEVTLIVPKILDSKLVRYSSRSVYETLLESGVKIAEFSGGLLHSKIITVDHKVTFVGSHNMDKRSFYINFEVSIMAYSDKFSLELEKRQQGYLESSALIDLAQWKKRPNYQKVLENIVRLVSPVL